MTYETFKSIFTVLYNETKKQNQFIDSIPRSINMAFCDNEYTDSMATEKRLLMKHLFIQPIFEDIDYFLYEGPNFKIIIQGKTYTPTNFEEILNYFNEVHFKES